LSTATAQIGHRTRATQRCTPHSTQIRHRSSKEKNRYPADAACSGIRVAHPDAPRAMPLQGLQTRHVHIHSKLCSRKSAIICCAAQDHVHVRTSMTQPRRLQKFVRAVRDIRVGNPLIQSTRDGLCEPLNLDTICVSSLRISREVAGSRAFPSSVASPKEPVGGLYRVSARLRWRIRPRMVIGTRR
jgi:hypothetical protein